MPCSPWASCHARMIVIAVVSASHAIQWKNVTGHIHKIAQRKSALVTHVSVKRKSLARSVAEVPAPVLVSARSSVRWKRIVAVVNK
ncbi:MAG: hypothetical protein S4CHLAM102_12130 [Chlamydiia bacterium]|nr:hypothetical protein [Chlamydiia bacterium]